MTQYYQDIDFGHFNYELSPLYDVSDVVVRGPLPDRDKPFIAFVGAAQTFGRFCERPFPTILAQRTGIPALNLGLGGCGPRTFMQPKILDILNDAQCVVLQVLSGRSESNSKFKVGHGGTDVLGTRVSDEVVMRAEEFFVDFAQANAPAAVNHLIAENCASYLEKYKLLFDSIKPKTILHWFARHTPEPTPHNILDGSLFGYFPHWIDRSMIEEMQNHCDAYVETVSNEGWPQQLWQAGESIDGGQLQDGYLYNYYYPSPEMHRQAAADLEYSMKRLFT
ncbi:MAG: DUF6473 family protein [Pseudomonadota bacterium]